MKLSVKKYLIGWIVVVGFALLWVVLGRIGLFAPHHVLARNPYSIESIVNLDLPDVLSADSQDNLERGSSRWDCYEHNVRFAESLSEACVRELEGRCESDGKYWSRKGDCSYEYYNAAWDEGENYCVRCIIREDSAYIEYYVDESEGAYVIGLGIIIVGLGVAVLVIWGLILFIRSLFRVLIMSRGYKALLWVCVIVSILLPIIIQGPINTLFRDLFNPPGWNILKPNLRVISTLVCYFINICVGFSCLALAKAEKPLFVWHAVLAFLWCGFVALICYSML